MKMLLAALAIVAATVGAGIGYAGMKTTALPSWYGEEAANTEAVPVSEPSAAVDPNDVVISSGQLNQMVTDAISQQPYIAPVLDIAKGVNTSIEDGRIESGAVLNISDIPLETLPPEGQQAVTQLTQTFPFLANREVYLGVEGSPTVVDGALSLDDTHIKVGQLSLPIANVASQMGISQSDLEQQLSGLLAQQGLTPSDVQVLDGQLVIKGQPQ
jgi:hypothetical protein